MFGGGGGVRPSLETLTQSLTQSFSSTKNALRERVELSVRVMDKILKSLTPYFEKIKLPCLYTKDVRA